MMLQSHDYYVHPTWFDQCQMSCVSWLQQYYDRYHPNLWRWVFNFFAFLCYFFLAIIVVKLALSVGQTATTVGGLQSIASTLAVALSLGGAVQFQRLAAQAEPARPRQSQPHHQPLERPVNQTGTTVRGRGALQAFFSRMHKAGIPMEVARGLLGAGITSEARLMAADDRVLLAIHGVDRGVIRALRTSI